MGKDIKRSGVDLAEFVKKARTAIGKTQEQFGELFGRTKANVSSWESGKHTPSYEQMLRMRDLSGIALPEQVQTIVKRLDSSTIEMLPSVFNADLFPPVKRVSFMISAGVSGFAVEFEEDEEEPIVFRREWYLKNHYTPGKLFAVKVTGDSMEPSLFAGDTIIVNTEDESPRDGEVFAVNYEGEMVVKRLHRDSGVWWLRSDHSDQRRFAPKMCTDQTFIIGRVVYKQSARI